MYQLSRTVFGMSDLIIAPDDTEIVALFPGHFSKEKWKEKERSIKYVNTMIGSLMLKINMLHLLKVNVCKIRGKQDGL